MRIQSARSFHKYFSEIVEDYPILKLPREFHACATCGNADLECHMLLASHKGIKMGVSAVTIVMCSPCGIVRLSQVLTDDTRKHGLPVDVIQALADELGFGGPAEIGLRGWPK